MSELHLVSGLRTNGRDNQYIFGGNIILSAFMVQNNSLGILSIGVLKKGLELGTNLEGISTDDLVSVNLPETQLVFANTKSIDVMIKQLTLIKNKLNKTDESKND